MGATHTLQTSLLFTKFGNPFDHLDYWIIWSTDTGADRTLWLQFVEMHLANTWILTEKKYGLLGHFAISKLLPAALPTCTCSLVPVWKGIFKN